MKGTLQNEDSIINPESGSPITGCICYREVIYDEPAFVMVLKEIHQYFKDRGFSNPEWDPTEPDLNFYILFDRLLI